MLNVGWLWQRRKKNQQTSNVNNGDKTNSHIFTPHLLDIVISFCFLFVFSNVISKALFCWGALFWRITNITLNTFCLLIYSVLLLFCNKWIMPTPELYINSSMGRAYAHTHISESPNRHAHEALTFRYHICVHRGQICHFWLRCISSSPASSWLFPPLVTLSSQSMIKLRKHKSAMTTTTTNDKYRIDKVAKTFD